MAIANGYIKSIAANGHYNPQLFSYRYIDN
jgi:hypothetical protein